MAQAGAAGSARTVVLVGAMVAAGLVAWLLAGGAAEGGEGAAGRTPPAAVEDAADELASGDVEPTPAPAAAPRAEPQPLASPAAEAPEPTPEPSPGFEAVPDARLAGHVLTTDGAPLPGATVQVFDEQSRRIDGRWTRRSDPVALAETDEHGAFTLDALPREFSVSAVHAGWACAHRVKGEATAGLDAQGASLVMEPALALSGRVLTEHGAPVAGARLELEPADGGEPVQVGSMVMTPATEQPAALAVGVYPTGPASVEARSDGDGSFRLAPLPAGAFTLRVKHDAHPTWYERVTVDGAPLDVVLATGASLVGIVYGADGDPLPGVELFLADIGAWGGSSLAPREAVTDEDGAFVLAGLGGTSTGYLRLRAEGHAVHVVEGIEIPADERVFAEYEMLPERVIAGVFRDLEGAPVPDLDLHVKGERVIDFGMVSHHPTPTWEERLARSRTTTDAQGAFRFPQLYEGRFELCASRDGEPVGMWTVEAGSEDLAFTIDAAALGSVGFRGLVRDATGLPIPRFRIFVWQPSSSGGMSGRPRDLEDPEGRFEILGLNPGPMRIEAEADGHHSDKTGTLEYGPGVHELLFELAPHRELALRVLHPDGSPVVDAWLAFHDRYGESFMVPTGGGATSTAVQTDARGEVHVYELPAGPVEIKISTEWGNVPQVERFDLSAPLPGVQTVYLDEELTSRPTRRDVKVMLLVLGEELPEDLVTTDSAELIAMQAGLAAAFASGELGFLARSIELRFRSADGEVEEQAVYGQDEQGNWVRSGGGGGSWMTAERPGHFSWDVPVGAGTLTLDIEGKGSRSIDLPAGSDEVHAVLHFAEP